MRSHSPRVLGTAACGLLLLGWLLGSTLSPPVAQTQVRAVPAATPPALPAIVPLQNLAAVMPRAAAPAPARNPFVFRGAAPRAVAPHADPGAEAPAAVDADVEAAPVAAPASAWRLLGMATAADGTFTAVLGGAGDVHLARSGDSLPGGVGVTEVTGDAVRLVGADGVAIDLRLP